MEFECITEQQAWERAVSCNQAFHGGEYPPALYELRERSGYDWRQCACVDTRPDGGDDSFGRLIGPGCVLLCFQLSPGDPSAASIGAFPLEPGRPSGLPGGVEPISDLAMALRYYDVYVTGRQNAAP